MDLIVRGHQVVQDGYEFFSKRQLVTLWGAPNYCDENSFEFDNGSAIMSIDETLLISFQVCLRLFIPSHARSIRSLMMIALSASQTCGEEAEIQQPQHSRVGKSCEKGRILMDYYSLHITAIDELLNQKVFQCMQFRDIINESKKISRVLRTRPLNTAEGDPSPFLNSRNWASD